MSIISRVGMEICRGCILPRYFAQLRKCCFYIWMYSSSIELRSTQSNMRSSSNCALCKFYKDISNNRKFLRWKAQQHKILESINWHKLCRFIRTSWLSTSNTSNCQMFHTQCMGISKVCKSSFERLDSSRSCNTKCMSGLIQLNNNLMCIRKCNYCLEASKGMSKMSKWKEMCKFHSFLWYNAWIERATLKYRSSKILINWISW